MPHRFFVAPDTIQNGVVHLSAAQAHQLRDVLRLAPGEQVIVLDNRGSEYRVALTALNKAGARGEILSSQSARGEPHTEIVLYQSLLKADKFEWVLQKGTEVGIAGFVPIVSERTIADKVSAQKFARWSAIVTEAAEQAHRGKLPRLMPAKPFLQGVREACAAGGASLILWEEEGACDLRSALDGEQAPLHLFVGPEGGFSAHEVEAAVALGAETVTLGPRILRAETAGMVASSVILFVRGDLKRIDETEQG